MIKINKHILYSVVILVTFATTLFASPFRDDALAYEKASYQLEMHYNKTEALVLLKELCDKPSRPMYNASNILLGKYYLNSQDTLNAIKYFSTAFTSASIPLHQKEWLGARLLSLGITRNIFIHNKLTPPEPIASLHPLTQSIYGVSKKGQVWQVDQNDLIPIPTQLNKGDSLLSFTDNLIITINNLRTLLTMQELTTPFPQYTYPIDNKIVWIQATPTGQTVLRTQQKILLIDKGKLMWSRTPEISFQCSFVGFIKHTNSFTELCTDNQLHIRSLHNGETTAHFLFNSQPKALHQVHDGIITSFTNSIEKSIINETVVKAWSITTPPYHHSLIIGNHLYLLTTDGSLQKINSITGENLWSQKTNGTHLVDLRNKLGCYSDNGLLHVFEYSGKPLWSYNFGSPFLAPPASSDTDIYIPTQTGTLRLNNNYYGILPTLQDVQFTRAEQFSTTDPLKTVAILDSILLSEPGNSRAHTLKSTLCVQENKNKHECLPLLHAAALASEKNDIPYKSIMSYYSELINARWVTKPAHKPSLISPLLIDSTHYYQLFNGGIIAHTLSKNEYSWNMPLSITPQAHASTIDNQFLYTTRDSLLFQIELHSTTQLNNTLKLPGSISQLKSYPDVLLAQTADNNIHLIQKNPFLTLWTVPLPYTKIFLPNSINTQSLAIISDKGTIHNINRSNGTPLSALTISSYVIDTVTSDNNAIYIVNKDNAIIAYRQQTMQPEWVTDFNAPIVKIVNTDSYLCVESTDKTLTCLHKSSGKRAWETYMKQTAFMTIHNQALYCAVDNVLYTFSVSSGELISKIQYPDALIGFQKNHNTLILNSEQGLLYTLDL